MHGVHGMHGMHGVVVDLHDRLVVLARRGTRAVPGAGEAALVPHAVGFLPGFSGSRTSL
jgi:hypothetical protein